MLEKLQSASFKGVTFLIESTSTNGGRKTVTHEYPNSDRRFVEDLGDLQEIFSLTGVISGDNYIQDRDALISALKEPDRGDLVHPFYGTVKVVAKPYSLSEGLTSLGIARFNMTFEKSDESVFPSGSDDNTSLINQQTNLLASYVGADLASIFSVRKKYPSNFLSAKTILTGVSAAMGINADNILQVADEVSSFSGFLLGFTNNINSNINDPTNLAYDFGILFGSFSTIGRNARDQFDLLTKLFNYGENDVAIQETTAPRIERATNQVIINSAVNTNALAYAYNTVPQLSLTTEIDIKEIEDQLDAQFNYTIANNNLTDITVQALKDLRVEVTQFLEQATVNAFRISTIETHELPMTMLCFQYYGSVDNTQALINLNNTIDTSFVSGNVGILVT